MEMMENSYIRSLETTGSLSEPAMRKAIGSFNLAPGAKVLDVSCGTGSHALWMLESNPRVKITGVDIAKDHVDYARAKLSQAGFNNSCRFEVGDMNQLKFEDNTFDLVWCCDGLWPGSIELGCPAEEPYEILDQMVRVTKPGGRIAILFWSSQKLLPGYPMLEAQLNATRSAMLPTNPEINLDLHFMRTPYWMQNTGLEQIESHTFVADIQEPMSSIQKEGLITLFNMFWAGAEKEVSRETWEKYQSLVNPESPGFIIRRPGYSGFLTYTMFIGEKHSKK